MLPNTYHRMLLLAGLLVVLGSAAPVLKQLGSPKPPPDIKGVFLPQGRALEDFSLVDHQGQHFSRDNLRGRWHLVSYGFTYCPDICPMALVTLTHVLERIGEDDKHQNLGVLFYSVDSERDTPEQLARYVPHFHPDFIGLTSVPANTGVQNGFERSLGIVARIDPQEKRENPDRYSVSHGISLYLINPDAELQAMFEPELNRYNIHQFSEARLYRDYKAIRAYLD